MALCIWLRHVSGRLLLKLIQRRIRGHAALIGACACLGCASPGSPVTQLVRIETPGSSVACDLSNDKGQWHVDRTPATVEVITSLAPLKVSCRAPDGAAGDTGAGSRVAPAEGKGALAGGVAGGAAAGLAFGGPALAFIPPLGAIIVVGSIGAGAAAGQVAEEKSKPIRYPEVITVTLGSVPPAAADAVRWGLTVRGLGADEAKALGIGARGAVLVIAVAAGGRAAAAQLRAGDVVLAIDGADVVDAADLEHRLRSLAPEKSPTLSLWREGRRVDLLLARAP